MPNSGIELSCDVGRIRDAIRIETILEEIGDQAAVGASAELDLQRLRDARELIDVEGGIPREGHGVQAVLLGDARHLPRILGVERSAVQLALAPGSLPWR